MTAAPSIAVGAATPSASRAQDFIGRSVVGEMRIGHAAPVENRSACRLHYRPLRPHALEPPTSSNATKVQADHDRGRSDGAAFRHGFSVRLSGASHKISDRVAEAAAGW